MVIPHSARSITLLCPVRHTSLPLTLLTCARQPLSGLMLRPRCRICRATPMRRGSLRRPMRFSIWCRGHRGAWQGRRSGQRQGRGCRVLGQKAGQSRAAAGHLRLCRAAILFATLYAMCCCCIRLMHDRGCRETAGWEEHKVQRLAYCQITQLLVRHGSTRVCSILVARGFPGTVT